jgi:hypothetical protein
MANSLDTSNRASDTQSLPDADYIAWTDYERVEHVAIRYGHPANNVWSVNGETISTAQLRELICGNCPYPLMRATDLAEQLRIAKRDAWAEGHEAGHDDYVGNDGSWPGTKNPYGDVS